MSREGLMLSMRAGVWALWRAGEAAEPIARIALDPEADDAIERAVMQLRDAMRTHAADGAGLVLAASSEDCLATTIDASDQPRRGARQAMLYRLEEKLPMTAEQVTADFVGEDAQALGVCVETARWERIITAMKSAQIAVEMISPMALLATQHVLSAEETAGANVMVLAGAGRVDLIALKDGKPRLWRSGAAVGADMERQLKMMALQGGEPLRLIVRADAIETLRRRIDKCGGEVVSAAEMDIDHAAALAASAITAGRMEPWVNFCRDELAAANPMGQLRRPLRWAIAAVLAMWLSAAGAMLWRAGQYDALAATSEAQQVTIYKNLFGERAVPINVRSRLESERRGMAGMRMSDADATPAPTSILPTLHQTLAAMPTNLRFSIQDIQLDETNLSIDGLVNAHSSADAIATALKQATGWQVQPPSTELLSNGGVGFTIRATAHDPDAQAAR
ncbi:MAG: hypothetical protein GC162_07055 [Planctomycetes bacterium]|nr:hypothetical protein [Planctomycetota bacterium]